jgi:signal transduction histidine kinase
MGDPGRFLQAMANLLSNAAKFSERDTEVVVELAREQDAARVIVRDTGFGIPEDFHARVFQKFAQADSGDTRAQGGTGLGLSICKAIVERHGGRIGFESRPGATSFFFTIPLLAGSGARQP